MRLSPNAFYNILQLAYWLSVPAIYITQITIIWLISIGSGPKEVTTNPPYLGGSNVGHHHLIAFPSYRAFFFCLLTRSRNTSGRIQGAFLVVVQLSGPGPRHVSFQPSVRNWPSVVEVMAENALRWPDSNTSVPHHPHSKWNQFAISGIRPTGESA